MHCIIDSVQCIVYSVHYTRRTVHVQYTQRVSRYLISIRNVLVKCTAYTVHCTVCFEYNNSLLTPTLGYSIFDFTWPIHSG